MVDTGYQPGSGAGAGTGGGAPAPNAGRTLDALKKDYLAYLSGKSEEIKEQQDARRYYHAAQWTAKQIETLNKRRQPVVTFNRIGRKINAVVGLLERQRQDPRGYPRTPKHEEGAEVATAVLRYVLDEQEWTAKSPIAGLNGAVDGIGGIELMLEQGDKGDVEVGFDTVDPGSFFYDARSLRMDFIDARYMGIGKWADVDMLIEQFPAKEAEIKSSLESGSDLTSNPDSDRKWVGTEEGSVKRIRVVDHWYIHGGEWHWCVYTGATKLAEGISPYRDQKKRTFCKYIMFSANVDHDGDRYGFVRNMKSSQDEINQRRSKGLHLLNSRRIIVRDGEGLDVEKLRREMARPDGVGVIPPGATDPIFDDGAKSAELAGHLGMLTEAKEEIENYGFNPALMGTGVQDMSGRAIQLQQQAGIAELGPYLLAYKGWKLRVYRAIWNAVQQHWTAERWIRVTDDEKVAQFFAVNQLGVDPATGNPAIVNQLGSLDVDIILDEGPDTINMQADAYETVSMMASKGQPVPPELLIEMSPLPGSVKKKAAEIIAKSRQQEPPPAQQAAMKLELEGKNADNQKTMAETAKIVAETRGMGAAPGADPQTQALDLEIKRAEARLQELRDANKMRLEDLKGAYSIKGQQLDLESKRLDLTGKRMSIIQQRERPQPQTGA